MKDDSFIPTECPGNILDSLHIQLLKNSGCIIHKENLFCSYMSFGQKYENELLIIGIEPSYLPSDFTAKELNDRGAVEVLKLKFCTMLSLDSIPYAPKLCY